MAGTNNGAASIDGKTIVEFMYKGIKEIDRYWFNKETDEEGDGSSSNVYKVEKVKKDGKKKDDDGNSIYVGTGEYSALKVLKFPELKTGFDSNYQKVLKLNDSPFVLKPSGLSEVVIDGKKHPCVLSDLMDMDCADYIDRVNKVDSYGTDEWPLGTLNDDDEVPFGNPEAFMNPEVLATSYAIILNSLLGMNELHYKNKSPVDYFDFHLFNLMIKGDFDGPFLMNPESLEVKITDMWPDKEGVFAQSGKTIHAARSAALYNQEGIEKELKDNPDNNPERRMIECMLAYHNSPATMKKLVPGVDPRKASDLYSLGRLAIELLTGLLPDAQANMQNSEGESLGKLMGTNSGITPKVGKVILSLLRPTKKAVDYFNELKEAIEEEYESFRVVMNKNNDNKESAYYFVEMPFHRFTSECNKGLKSAFDKGELRTFKEKVYDPLFTEAQALPNCSHETRIADYFNTELAKLAKEAKVTKGSATTEFDDKTTEYQTTLESLNTQKANLKKQLSTLEATITDTTTDRDTIIGQIEGRRDTAGDNIEVIDVLLEEIKPYITPPVPTVPADGSPEQGGDVVPDVVPDVVSDVVPDVVPDGNTVDDTSSDLNTKEGKQK